MKPTTEQIEKLAEWWAAKAFDVALNQDNGEPSHFLLMNALAMAFKSDLSPEMRAKFKMSIMTQLAHNDPKNGYTLSVDYDPCFTLREACEISGVSPHSLPCKTVTVFSDGVFKGKFGYGKPFELIG
jgi:hypothetical protein